MKARKRKQVLAARYQSVCGLCHGARGGVRGNNQIIHGKVVCDYCHSDMMPNSLGHASMPLYYRLDANRIPIPCFNIMEWAEYFQEADRRVARDECEQYVVSTVFLGLDHNYFGGDPILFETMVFLPEGESGDMDRYHTWADALAGHERIKSMLEFELSQSHTLAINALKSIMEPRP